MDCYRGRDIGYHIVPTGREPTCGFTSLDYMLQQSASMSENNNYFVGVSKSSIDLSSNMQELTIHENEGLSYPLNEECAYGLSTFHEVPLVNCSGGVLQALPPKRTGLLGDVLEQLKGLDAKARVDDISLTSRHWYNPSPNENSYHSMSTNLESDMLHNDHLTETSTILQSIPVQQPSNIANLNYPDQVCDIPRSLLCGPVQDTPLPFMMPDSKPKKCSLATTAPGLRVMIQNGLDTSCVRVGHMDEERSFKAKVLQDLVHVIGQMTPNTRICFRDALYRLANSSKQEAFLSYEEGGELSMDDLSSSFNQCETSKSGESKFIGPETNIIDRTMANLMFNQTSCNQPDPLSVSSVNQSMVALSFPGSYNNSLEESKINYYPPVSPHDAEVPIFG